MPGIGGILKEIGLNPLTVQDGASIDTTELIEELFLSIINRCVNGEKVRIKNFGVFEAKVHKGRTLRTPLMDGGEITYGDSIILKFKQSNKSKIIMSKIASELKKIGNKEV